jgi:hypothetical protein
MPFYVAGHGAVWHIWVMKRLVLIAALCAPVHAAQAQMSAEEFDEYTRGHTFYYAAGGAPYGGEEYLDDRRVRWSFLDGECQDGYWYEAGDLICFVYENNPDPQCWTFQRSSTGLVARFEGDTAMSELYEVEKSSEPLMCLGPTPGV